MYVRFMMSRSYSQIVYPCAVMNKNKDYIHSFRHRLIGLAVVIGLLALPVLKGLWQLWHCDKTFDGLLLVPFMCGFILYRSKDEFTSCGPRAVKWMLYILPITFGGMFAAPVYELPRIAGLLLVFNLLIVSFGILGYSNHRLFVGPFLFLMLMVPPPQPAVEFLTVNLQKFFSMIMEPAMTGFSGSFLERSGFEFWFAGIDYPMIIAPECSGIRSLLGFVIMSSFFAVFDRHSIAGAVLMITAGSVTALGLNFLRIFATMQMRACGLEEYTVGFWHGLLGIAVFMVGCVTLSRFSRFLRPIDRQNQKEVR